MRKLWRWFLAQFRLNLRVVCEESIGMGPFDYHDYPDADPPLPYHFVELKCVRCGKGFRI